MDEDKVEAILNWPTPKTGTTMRSFHGLAQFYRKFIRRFSVICDPVLDNIKGEMKTKSVWIKEENEGFKGLKTEVATKPILVLPSFDKLFIVKCDARNVVVGMVLSQEGRPVAFFSERLNEVK